MIDTTQDIYPQENLPTYTSSDKGAVARERLTTRVVAGTKCTVSYIAILAFIALVAIVGVGYANHKVSGYSYERQCMVPGSSGLDVVGVRKYYAKSLDVFGMTLMNVSDAEEVTRLASTMKGVSVVGIKGVEWWGITNLPAEPIEMVLKDADTYVFNQSGKSYVISYSDFCK